MFSRTFSIDDSLASLGELSLLLLSPEDCQEEDRRLQCGHIKQFSAL